MADVLATEEFTDAGVEPTTGYWASFAAVLETVDDTTSSDTTAPAIINLVPVAGASISRTQTITFSVVDAALAAVVTVSIGVQYPGNTAEWVYNGTSFFSPFDTSSTVTPRGDGGFDFSITRTGGWPDFPTFHVIPVDAEGNV